jgi:ABC-type spermidine/putrescine transport system permease subunit II
MVTVKPMVVPAVTLALSAVFVIVSAGVDDEMVTVQVSDVVLVAELPELSITMLAKLKVPVAVGVPAIAPVDAFSMRPVGKLPEVIEKV